MLMNQSPTSSHYFPLNPINTHVPTLMAPYSIFSSHKTLALSKFNVLKRCSFASQITEAVYNESRTRNLTFLIHSRPNYHRTSGKNIFQI